MPTTPRWEQPPDRDRPELGVAHRGRAVRSQRGRRERQGSAGTALFLVVAFVLVGAVVALPRLSPVVDHGALAEATSTLSPPATPPATGVAVVLTSPSPVATPSVATLPAATPTPTLAPTPAPTAEPTPAPTPAPTPPPSSAPTPRPPAEEVVVRIENEQFVGAFAGRRSSHYLGRTASWVYGQGTQAHTMTASFRLRLDGEVGRRASLTIVGMDGENRGKNAISVVLNGVTIYEGPNPLPNDECCDAPGNWGSATFRFPGSLLRRNNTLSISNLEPDDCTRCPVYVMVDYVELTYRVRR